MKRKTVQQVVVNKVITELKAIRGAFECVPKNIAPNNDPGIYYYKAITDLDLTILNYEKLAKKEVKPINDGKS